MIKIVAETLNQYFDDFEDGNFVAYVSVCGSAIDIYDNDGSFVVTYDTDEALHEVGGI